MRVAVTGGCGFIGSHVVDVLVEAGHDVVAVDTAIRTFNESARYVECDVRDEAGLITALDACEVIFHLAGSSNVDICAEHPVETFGLNVVGTATVCEAARRVSARRVVLASTVWVYGAAADDGRDSSLTESTPFDLTRVGHVYTASKLGAEAVLHSYRELYGLGVTVLRFGIPYGPRMRDELVLARFVARARSGEPLTIAGDGAQTRNYVYVRDLAHAHLLALDERADGETFALEGQETVSVRQMAELVLDLTDSATALHTVPARAGDYQGREISARHAQDVLGWRPTTSFSDGVQAYLDWVSDQASDSPASAGACR